MSTIAGFLTRMILLRFFAIMLAITAFVLTLEVVGYISEILALGPGPFLVVTKYALLRSPTLLSTFLPMSLLLALLLTFTELSYRNEMTAIWAAGISPLRLIVLLVPVAVLVGGLHFIINDQAIPAASPTLRQWGIGDYASKKLNVSDKDPVWIRSGPDIMRATKVSADSKSLFNVIIFRRSPEGQLQEQIYAATATKSDARWLLENVAIYYQNNSAPTRLDTMIYDGAMNPAKAARGGDPDDMTLQDLNYFVANQGFGIRPVYVYQTARQKRFTPPIVALVMVALCVPLATRFKRGGGLGGLFAIGVALGFMFFVSDGIATAIGESGLVSPWLAAWAPVIVFGAIAIGLVARTERV